ncbi:hypothetical protein GPECTOR_28g849 [Gonium pectorale]|uniref:Dirigent protein n=1 Tax=Gonium pectorale TaxID=33097 RepID=A0A150GF16_GONPE|nr:hypothetical protein GPECTOR_28g849 [Gonium pectorale]|eukprot:KXZ48439.1 hypothetical protein GPECTOR_28g849 [Gonium pectorale]
MASVRCVALMVAALALLAGSASAQPPEGCMKTFAVTEKADPATFVVPTGVDPNNMTALTGISAGFTNPVVFGGSGNSNRTAGISHGFCYYFGYDAKEEKTYNYCHTTLVFYYGPAPIGSITFSGPFSDWADSVFENAISGGTGWFAGANGVVKVEVKSALEQYKYVVRLDEKSRQCK